MTAQGQNGRPSGLALGALVFGAGIGALATEITASRLLAPYFGSSTIVWANLIGIVLAALAVGYWLGGRLADRRPRATLLGSIVLVAAVCVAAIPFVAEPFLDLTVEGLDDASAGAVIGSFIAVLLLFAPPVVLLGMVSPFAIRLAVSSIETAGAVAGRLYALSTAGSLLGTFLPALILIPAIGTQRTFLVIAALLAASSCFLLGVRYLVVAGLLAALVLLPPGAVKAEAGLLHEETSYHQYIQVIERSDGRRVLHLNEGVAVHSVWQPGGNVLTGGVWDAFLALPPLLGTPARAGGDPRQRRGDDRAGAGRLLPRCGDRRRRARSGRQPRRSTLLRARGQQAPDRARRGRAGPSCVGPIAGTTSSSWTPTTSRTCPSTSRRASSSAWSATGLRRVASSRSTSPPCPVTAGS